MTRLQEDFKNSVQYGFEQCKRVEDYFSLINHWILKMKKGKYYIL
jgi:hypothetical protein